MELIKLNEKILQKILCSEIKSFSLKYKNKWKNIHFNKLEYKIKYNYLILEWDEYSFIKNTLKIDISQLKFDVELELLTCKMFEADFKKSIVL